MQGLATSYGDTSSMDEQPETPFAAGDTIPAGYSTAAGTAGIQTTPFTAGRNIPIEGPDTDAAAARINPDITSTTDSEVIHLNQRAANLAWPGAAAQPAQHAQHDGTASTFGTQPGSSNASTFGAQSGISKLGTSAPSGVQLSSTPLLGGQDTLTASSVASSIAQQQPGIADSNQLPSQDVVSSSQYARLSEPSTAASDASTGQDRPASGAAQLPLREERSLRSIYSLGKLFSQVLPSTFMSSLG